MFPFLLMGVLAPSPMYRQYFYPLVSFLVLGGVYAVAAVANSKAWWKGSIVICAAGVVVSTIFSMSPYRHLREFGSPGEWEPLQVHDGARQMLAPVPADGRDSALPSATNATVSRQITSLKLSRRLEEENKGKQGQI